MPSQVELCREWNAGGRVNEQHRLLSASTVPRPLAFIKESYPFTLIKRQWFYLEGDPSEPASSRCLTTNTHPLITFNLSIWWFLLLSVYISREWWCHLYFYLGETVAAHTQQSQRGGVDFWMSLYPSLCNQSHHPMYLFSMTVGLI